MRQRTPMVAAAPRALVRIKQAFWRGMTASWASALADIGGPDPWVAARDLITDGHAHPSVLQKSREET